MTQTNTGPGLQGSAASSQPAKSSPHYRMTPEMAKAEFEEGLTTIKGYVYYLLKSSRKDGHRFRIKSVKAFCKEHGFSTSAYYRAITELKASGRINFITQGHMDLWVPEKAIFSEERKSVPDLGHSSQEWDQQSQKRDIESQEWDTESQIWDSKASKPSEINDSSNPSDLLQLSFNFFTEKERERKSDDSQNAQVNNTQQIDPNEGGKQSNKLKEISSAEFEDTEWDQFSAPGSEPEFFEFVVRLTDKLETPPADPQCAAEGWIRKQGYILYPRYLKWKEGQQRAAARSQSPPVEIAPPAKPEPIKMTPQIWLERYQQMWQAGPQMQKQICDAITQHPDRGLRIGENGPELASAETP